MSPVKHAVPLLCLCGLMLPACAQNDGTPASRVPSDAPLTIDAAVAVALANHPSVAIARDQVVSAQGGLTQARSQIRPSAAFQSGYSRSMSSGSSVVSGVEVGGAGDQYSTQYSAGLSADQLLFDFGRSSDEVRSSRLNLEAASLRLGETQQDVALNAQQTFLALVTNGELLEVAEYRVRLQEGTLEMVRAQNDEGIVPRADVAKASAAVAAAQYDVAAAGNAVALSRVALNEAMGIDVRTDYQPATPAEPELPALDPDELIGVALASRPEIPAARADVQAAQASLAAAGKGQKPSVSASSTYGLRGDGFAPDRDHWSLGVSLSMSVFDGGLTRGRTQQARAQRDAAEASAFDAEQRIAQQTATALFDLQTAREQTAAAEVSVASATEDLDLATGRYVANVGILLEVLDAETTLTSAQADLALARFDLQTAYYALERAIGVPLATLVSTDGESAPE